MKKFSILFENDNGGMYDVIDVSSHTFVTVDSQRRVQLSLANGDVIQIPVNPAMEDKINEPSTD